MRNARSSPCRSGAAIPGRSRPAIVSALRGLAPSTREHARSSAPRPATTSGASGSRASASSSSVWFSGNSLRNARVATTSGSDSTSIRSIALPDGILVASHAAGTLSSAYTATIAARRARIARKAGSSRSGDKAV